MELKLDKNSLYLRYEDERELFDLLLDIHGYTKVEFGEMFDLEQSSVQNWTRKDRTPPKWAIKYLIDTLERDLRLIGYMLKLKKAQFVVYEIQQVQDEIRDLRVQDQDNIPQAPISLEIGNLITENKPINTAIISNMAKILNNFKETLQI